MEELRGKKFWIVLLLGFVSYIFFNGVYNVDLIALISPAFFLLITRNTSRVSDFLLITLAMGIAGIIKYPDLIWAGFPLDQLCAFTVVSLLIIPFIIDRFIFRNFTREASRRRKFAATLILPTIFTVIEILFNYIYAGTVFSVSIILNDIFPFMQFASIVGQYGLAFIIMWVPSFIYFMIDIVKGAKGKSFIDFFNEVKVPVSVFLITFVVIFAYGELRINFGGTQENYVKVAFSHGIKQHLDENGIREPDTLSTLEKVFDQELTTASKSGAKLVCFGEQAFYVYSNDYNSFVDFIREEAKTKNVFVSVGIDCKSSTEGQLSRNIVVLVDKDGVVKSEYDKSKLIPLVENHDYLQGNGNIEIIPLELIPGVTSMVSTAICFEGEFNSYIDQVGLETDIHLNPSYEWIRGSEFHNKAIQLRSIEHGMSVIEPTIHNTSAIFDCIGKVVASSNTDETGFENVTFGDIPAQGIYTFYVLVGFVLDYCYLPMLVLLIALSILRWKRTKNIA